jgi:DNA-binding NtrC family response regulator
MTPTIVVLNNQSDEVAELVQKLKSYGFGVEEVSSPAEALDKVASAKPRLLVASGEYQDTDTSRLAEKVYEAHSIPTFLILATAGDSTQNRMIKHPGIIGVFFTPLNVDKLFERVRRFFEMLNTPQNL